MNQQNNSASDCLTHYGVLGMKWGVRRGKTGSAYSKGIKKLKKLDKKATGYRVKSDKADFESARIYAKGRNDDKAKKLNAKSRKLKYKSTILEQKGKKFYKKMEKIFKDVSPKELNPNDIDYGKRYANRVLS